MKIRKAKKEDARKISLMRRETIRKVNSKDYPNKIIDILYKNNSAKEILTKMKERVVFCAIDGNRIVGTIDLEGNKVGGLYVRVGFLGKGIGKMLLEHLESYAKSKRIKKLILYSTLTAEGFYRKQGYKLSREEIGWKDVCPVRVPVMEKRIK